MKKYCIYLFRKLCLRQTYSLYFNGATLHVCAVQLNPPDATFSTPEPIFLVSAAVGRDRAPFSDGVYLSCLDVLMRVSCVPALPGQTASRRGGAGLRPWLADASLTINDRVYVRREALGRGATAMVCLYARSDDMRHLWVVKRVRDDLDDNKAGRARDSLAFEVTVLHTLNDCCDSMSARADVIPTVVEHDVAGTVLKPRCNKLVFSPRNYETVVHDLVSALFIAASSAVVHRDVRPENIMLSDTGRGVLLDWGFAVCDERAHPYCGTLQTVADDVLESFIKADGFCPIAMAPKHDAEALVKSLILMMPDQKSTADRLAQERKALREGRALFEAIRDVWRGYFVVGCACSFWTAALAAARAIQLPADATQFLQLEACLKKAVFVHMTGMAPPMDV